MTDEELDEIEERNQPCSDNVGYNEIAELIFDVRRARQALEQIINASDGCCGHRGCNHSMQPWQMARDALKDPE